MESQTFSGRLALQQRVLPAYRAPFFDLLAMRCQEGMSVFTGLPEPGEEVFPTDRLRNAEYVRGINRHYFKGPAYICWQTGLIEWLSNVDPDLLIVEANPRYLSNQGAIRWMRSRDRPVLGWGLGAPGRTTRSVGIGKWIGPRYLKQFDGILAYSSPGAASFREAGVPTEAVYVAINSVSGPPGPLPKREPVQGRKLRVLFVGRLQRRKRVDSLLTACSRIAESLELWIVGDGPAKGEFENLASRVYPSAKFFGSLHGERLDERFDRADLFVLPGTGGLALQQAMAHGLPCIAAEGDGTQLDLVGAENGWLVEPGDLAALEEALSAAVAQPERLQEMGEISWRIVKERANIEIMCSTFVRAMNAGLRSA
jgi:glycosyltransferase involved in cell wall biosynthesis